MRGNNYSTVGVNEQKDINSYTHTHTCAKAKVDLWLLILLCMYTYIHACAAAKLESQRTAGSKTSGEGAAAAGRTKLLLYYCRTHDHETPGAPEDTRGNEKGHQRDRRAQAQRHHTPRGPEAGGHSGGIGRDTKRTGGNNGGIGASRKATRTQRKDL